MKTFNVSSSTLIIDKAGPSTSFTYEDTVSSGSLSAKKLMLTINDCDSNKNKDNVDPTRMNVAYALCSVRQ